MPTSADEQVTSPARPDRSVGPEKRRCWTVPAALLALLLFCYANSFTASWHYDDYANIVENPRIRMGPWSWTATLQAMQAGQESRYIARPLAYLSFAINYRIGGTNVFGYHLFNFAVHWVTSCILFLFIRGTLELPVFRRRSAATAHWVALIATVFWACHPIQVTAVTYIVQRMTVMAGMFYVISLYLFLTARRSTDRKKRHFFYGLSCLSGVAAVLCKENSILLPYAVVLYGLLFFKPLHYRTVLSSLAIGIGMTLLAFAIGFLFTDPLNLLAPYSNRPWTMAERLLTQPRVLFFYLLLLAVPGTARMSILHDVPVSTSLMDPWTTLPAIAVLAGLVGFLIWLAPRQRMIAFSGLFFFLNHLVESSMLNLELIYEHRNYVPSMLVFVPLALGILRSLDFFSANKVLRNAIGGVTLVAVLSQCSVTIAYNALFSNEFRLWTHARILAPAMSLPHVALSTVYWKLGEHALTRLECEAALRKDRFNDIHQKATAFFNLGIFQFEAEKDYRAALDSFQNARAIADKEPTYWYWIAKSYLADNANAAAFTELERARRLWPEDRELIALSGVVCCRLEKWELARQSAEVLYRLDPESRPALMLMGQVYRNRGELGAAIATWEKFHQLEPDNIYGLLALIELHGLKGAPSEIDRRAAELHRKVGSQNGQAAVDAAIRRAVATPYVPDAKLLNALVASSKVK